jgi:hypothetical protein
MFMKKLAFVAIAILLCEHFGPLLKAQVVDNPISITGIANSNYPGILPGFPSGNVVLGGVMFNIPTTYPVFLSNTQDSVLPDLSATLTTNIANVSNVYLLINTETPTRTRCLLGTRLALLPFHLFQAHSKWFHSMWV